MTGFTVYQKRLVQTGEQQLSGLKYPIVSQSLLNQSIFANQSTSVSYVLLVVHGLTNLLENCHCFCHHKQLDLTSILLLTDMLEATALYTGLATYATVRNVLYLLNNTLPHCRPGIKAFLKNLQLYQSCAILHQVQVINKGIQL